MRATAGPGPPDTNNEDKGAYVVMVPAVIISRATVVMIILMME